MLYRVVNYNGKECVYEEPNEEKAYKLARQYSKACGDYYVDEAAEGEVEVSIDDFIIIEKLHRI